MGLCCDIALRSVLISDTCLLCVVVYLSVLFECVMFCLSIVFRWFVVLGDD